MQRRDVLTGLSAAVAAAMWPLRAHAHHGWSSFDQTRPLYLEGVARQVRWRNPHAEFTLELAPNLALPADLAQRIMPAQTARVDANAILANTRLPTRRDARWAIELAPLTRINQWRIPEIADGTPVALIGFTFAGEQGDALLRAEYLFLNGQVYGLRSSPAS